MNKKTYIRPFAVATALGSEEKLLDLSLIVDEGPEPINIISVGKPIDEKPQVW